MSLDAGRALRAGRDRGGPRARQQALERRAPGAAERRPGRARRRRRRAEPVDALDPRRGSRPRSTRSPRDYDALRLLERRQGALRASSGTTSATGTSRRSSCASTATTPGAAPASRRRSVRAGADAAPAAPADAVRDRGDLGELGEDDAPGAELLAGPPPSRARPCPRGAVRASLRLRREAARSCAPPPVAAARAARRCEGSPLPRSPVWSRRSEPSARAGRSRRVARRWT